MTLTLVQLSTATGCGVVRAQTWLPAINQTLDAYEINTPARIAAFLAQIGHESGSLHFLREVWGPTTQQARYERDFKAAWPPKAPDVRNDLAYRLGNVNAGDGHRYRGAALLETTGRANFARTRNRLRLRFGPGVPDFEAQPDDLALTPWAALAAGDYWDDHKINEAADAGDFDAVSDLINFGRHTPREGDSNGYRDRLARFELSQKVLA
jgi:putative chitinase